MSPLSAASPPTPAADVLSLVSRARAGDRRALGALLSSQRHQMGALALELSHSQADADDIVQEACLRAVQKLGQYRGDAPFGAWLRRITLNTGLLLLRRRRQQRLLPLTEPAAAVAAIADGQARVDDRCHHRQRLRAVMRASRRMRPTLLQALVLREMHGLDGAELAQRLGITTDLAKMRLHRARSALRALLEQENPGFFK